MPVHVGELAGLLSLRAAGGHDEYATTQARTATAAHPPTQETKSMRRLLAVVISALLLSTGITACVSPEPDIKPYELQVQVQTQGEQPTLSAADLDATAIAGITQLENVTSYVLGAPMEIGYEGELPESGATLTRRYEVWAATPTSLSQDRRTITATVHHFSKWTDIIAGTPAAVARVRDAAAAAGKQVVQWTMNAATPAAEAIHWSIGNALSTRIELPECDVSTPKWVIELPIRTDVDDPVRFCAGHDERDPELLVLKARANRGYGFPVNLSPSPTWEHNSSSDYSVTAVIDTIGGLDKAIGESVSQLLNDGRFIGAGEEISFGISLSAMRDSTDEYVLELPAPSVPQFIATTLTEQLIGYGVSQTDGLLAASIAVGSCWSKVSEATDPGNGAGAMLTCLVSADEQIARLLGEALLARGLDPATAGRTAGQSIGRMSVALALLPAVVNTLDYIAETGLPRNARALSVEINRNAVDEVPGFPSDLQGRWCTRSDIKEQECFSIKELKEEYPETKLDSTSSGYAGPASRSYGLCLEVDQQDSCGMSSLAIYEYFPAGVAWDCTAMNWTGMACDPDYTENHDSSVPRLVRIPNHQQDETYHDAPPMYQE
jgi:hypothetical protein